jgi:Xaa-Pro aminopeptidase
MEPTMLTVHPTLLIGPSDWDAERMPSAEFVGRIEALFEKHPGAERAIVFGNSRHHAELAYFTNLVPKLGPALALISRDGAHRMFVGDAANMLGAARPLTFIEDLASMKEAASAIAAGKSQRTLLIGADYMPTALRGTITEAVGKETSDATAQAWRQMARKSGYELDAIDIAMKLNGIARKAMREALMAGAGVAGVVVTGERAAHAAGAQEVRSLFSLDGGRTLQPFLARVDQTIDPLLIYLAIRRFNYWAESFPLFTQDPAPTKLYDKAWDVLMRAAAVIKAGIATRDVAELIAAGIAPYQVHPVTAKSWAQRMGIALDEAPHTEVGETFEEGEVYSLRIGAADEPRESLICSRMFIVGKDGITAFDEQP